VKNLSHILPFPNEIDIPSKDPLRLETGANHIIALELPAVSDMRLARDFVQEHRNRIRWQTDSDRWLYLADSKWHIDTNRAQVRNLARTWIEQRAVEIKETLTASQEETPLKIASVVKKIASAATLRDLVRTIETDPLIQTTADEWDADPEALGVPSGWVDLRTGRLYPDDASKLILQQTAVNPSDDEPQLWLSCLNVWTGGNAETIDFLQRLVGYSLTGHSREHVLPHFHGPGGNGKGLFTETIKTVLGTYSATLAVSNIQESRFQQHPTGLAALEGKRLVLVGEVDGSKLNVSLLKQLTGGEDISARGMRENPRNIKQTWTLFMVGNETLNFGTNDAAMQRRLRLVPWRATIANRDPSLMQKLEHEHSGILSWCIQGAVKYLCDGLQTPASILDESQAVLNQQDPASMWLEEQCLTGAAFREHCDRMGWPYERTGTPTKDLLVSVNEWLEAHGFRWTFNVTSFGRKLMDLGLKDTFRSGPDKTIHRAGVLLR
jgi:putative DNA primase/helicase